MLGTQLIILKSSKRRERTKQLLPLYTATHGYQTVGEGKLSLQKHSGWEAEKRDTQSVTASQSPVIWWAQGWSAQLLTSQGERWAAHACLLPPGKHSCPQNWTWIYQFRGRGWGRGRQPQQDGLYTESFLESLDINNESTHTHICPHLQSGRVNFI